MERNVREAERMGGRASCEKGTQKRYLRSEQRDGKRKNRGSEMMDKCVKRSTRGKRVERCTQGNTTAEC